MYSALATIGTISVILRSVLLAGGAVLAVVAAADWAVRTRRINPFSGLARFMRSTVDPRLIGVERQVLRVGGVASTTPWWALLGYIVIALLVLAGVDFVAGLLRQAFYATSLGTVGVLALVFQWVFAFLRLALLVRVVGSWFPRLAYSPWLRWSFGATEWMLRPLRRVIPSFGVIDVTPIVAYFGLELVQWLLGSVLFRGV
jgi:YggT family protein